MRLVLLILIFFSVSAFAGLEPVLDQSSGRVSWPGYQAKVKGSYKKKKSNKATPFEDVYIGTTKTWRYLFTGLTLSQYGMRIEGSPEFTMTTTCGGKQDCYVDVTFTPTSPGLKGAYLRWSYTNPDGPDPHFSSYIFGTALPFEECPECASEAIGSIIRIESRSVSETIPLVGSEFSLVYSSDHSEAYFTPYVHPTLLANFNPEGWTISNLHYFDQNTNHLFLGTGEMITRKPIALSSGNKMVVNDSNVFIFDSYGKHIETRSFLTGFLKYSFEYDTNSKIQKILDSFGNETIFNRDGTGNLSHIVAPRGQITSVQLDSEGQINSVTNPKNEIYTISYDPETKLISTFTKPGGHVSTFEFGDYGKLQKDYGSGGNLWDIYDDSDEEGIHYIEQASAMGRATTYYTKRVGNEFIRKVFGNAGFETNYVEGNDRSHTASNIFESSSSQTQNDERFGDALSRTSNYREEINGLTRFTEFLKSVTLSDSTDPFSYSQIVSTTKVNGVSTVNTFNKSTLTSSTVNPMGITSVTTFNSYERPISIQHGNDIPVSISYDSWGRVSQTTQNGTNSTSYTYNTNGEIASVSNALSQTTSYLYDDAGRTTRVTYPDGRFLRYRFNSDGKITAIYPPSRPAHVFAFNALELPSVYRPPMIPDTTTPQTRYYYNLDKQLTVIKRPDGKSVRYNYEPEVGLLMSMVLGPNERQSYSYQEGTEVPRVINSVDQVRSVFTYFGMDRIASEQQTVGNTTTKMIHGFDNFFRANRRIIQVDGTEVSRVVTAFRDDNQPIRVGEMRFTYDSTSGRLVSTILDKIRDRRTYDSFGNLKSYQATYHPEGSAAQELYFYTLTRDTLHRIVTKIERVQGQRTSYEYSYDSVGRLSSVTKNGAVDSSYAYDANSNRVSGTQNGQPFTATYDAQDRLLTYVQGNELSKQFTYNINGELTQIEQGAEITTLVPDSLGRLKSVTLPDNTAISYKLDWTGRRSARSVNGAQVVRSIFENEYQLAGELDSSNNLREYVSRTNVNSSDYFKQGSDLYRIIKDHLGSPRLVVKADDASVTQKMDYNEWGKVILDTNPGFQPFGFAGGLYDKDTKLVKFGARDYDGSVGRWTRKDPIRFRGDDSNLYSYAIQNPINRSDYNGLFSSSGTSDRAMCMQATLDTYYVAHQVGDEECEVKLKKSMDFCDTKSNEERSEDEMIKFETEILPTENPFMQGI